MTRRSRRTRRTPRRSRTPPSKLKGHEKAFYEKCREWGFPEPEPQAYFALPRLFQADFAWEEQKVIVEIQGAVWAKQGAKRCPHCGQIEAGAHGRGSGIEHDYERHNIAICLGWKMLLIVPKWIKDGTAEALLDLLLPRSDTPQF